MPDTFGSLTRRAAAAACLTLALVIPAAAQDPGPSPVDAPSAPAFRAIWRAGSSKARLTNGLASASSTIHSRHFLEP